MMEWNSSLYLKYGTERTQPAIDLASRIAVENPKRIIDLGCGPGNSTAVLQMQWPEAKLTGLDSSENMIELAKKEYPGIKWIKEDIADWSPHRKYDIIFSNAALQWLSNHDQLFSTFVDRLNQSGVLAVQVPYHYEKSPLHQAVVEVSKQSQWTKNMDLARGALTQETASFYYDVLSPLCRKIDIWETTYFHIMNSPKAILEWISGTGLRPFIESLTSTSDQSLFKEKLLEKITKAYPRQKNGKILFPFRRQFIVASK